MTTLRDEMREIHNERIKHWADLIRSKMEGGTLYGEPIDLDNSDHAIILAYELGRVAGGASTYNDYKLLIER